MKVLKWTLRCVGYCIAVPIGIILPYLYMAPFIWGPQLSERGFYVNIGFTLCGMVVMCWLLIWIVNKITKNIRSNHED